MIRLKFVILIEIYFSHSRKRELDYLIIISRVWYFGREISAQNLHKLRQKYCYLATDNLT